MSVWVTLLSFCVYSRGIVRGLFGWWGVWVPRMREAVMFAVRVPL